MHITRIPPAAPPQDAASTGLWRRWVAPILTRLSERHELHTLSDRELRDIGLTPTDVARLTTKPIWRR
jgi:uncharacterized protein YjiS (DUF1127 family)